MRVLRLRIIGACGAKKGTLRTTISYHIGTRALSWARFYNTVQAQIFPPTSLQDELNLVTWLRMVKLTQSNNLLDFHFLKSKNIITRLVKKI